jgi:hypothetical protein
MNLGGDIQKPKGESMVNRRCEDYGLKTKHG